VSSKIGYLVRAALIASIYTAVTFIFAPISFGPVQFRVSEALTILPVLTTAAIPGLFVGCILSNLLVGGLGPIDLIFGSLATLIAAYLTYKIRKNIWLAPLPPVILNGIIVGSYLPYLLPEAELYLVPSILSVMAGEAIVCYVLGLPLLLFLVTRWKYIDKTFRT
jgi:uncharacterized membrane protein